MGAKAEKPDDYHDAKPYHFAHLFDQKGNVSPICAAKPRRLKLDRELWTIRWEAVTCPKCLARRFTEIPA